MTAVIAHDPFGFAGCSRRIENVEGIGRGNGYAARRFGIFHHVVKVQIACRIHVRLDLGTLVDNAFLRFMSRNFNSLIQ